jgi:hypothetical protein
LYCLCRGFSGKTWIAGQVRGVKFVTPCFRSW